MQWNMEKIIILICSVYLGVRLLQEGFRFLKSQYVQDYLLLKRARQYKNNTEVYHYHLFHLAQKFMNEQKVVKAGKNLSMILADNPDYPLANYLMGVVFFHQNEIEQALVHLEREREHLPNHPLVYFFLSRCMNQIGRFEEALRALERSLELNPYYYSSYLVGLEIFQHLSLDPQVEWNFLHQAEVHRCLIQPVWLRMAELEKSFLPVERQAERACFYTELDENWQETNRIKEQTMQAINEKHFYRAENLIIEGLRINPHDNQLYQIYDQILNLQKKYAAALTFFEAEQQRINPNPLEASLRLTDYLVYNREYNRALEIMLDLYATYPNAQFLHYPLCILYNWLDQSTKALEHLAKAIYFDPSIKKLAVNNPELQNLREREEFQQLMNPKL